MTSSEITHLRPRTVAICDIATWNVFAGSVASAFDVQTEMLKLNLSDGEEEEATATAAAPDDDATAALLLFVVVVAEDDEEVLLFSTKISIVSPSFKPSEESRELSSFDEDEDEDENERRVFCVASILKRLLA